MIYVLYFSTILHLLLAFYILLSGIRSRLNIFFSIFLISSALWSLANAQFANSNNEDLTYFWAIFAYEAGSVLLMSFYTFSFLIKNQYKKLPSILLAWNLIGVISIILPLIPGFILEGVNQEEKLIEGTSYLPLLFLCYISLILLSLRNLFQTIKLAPILNKTQVELIAYGVTIGLLAGTTTNIILPSFGNYSLVTIGPSFNIIALSLVGLAIVRYEFLDIRFVLGNLIKYASFLIFITTFYYIVLILNIFVFGDYITFPGLLFSIPLGIIFLLLYNNLELLLSSLEKDFLSPHYNANQSLKSFNSSINKVYDEKNLSEIYKTLINETINPIINNTQLVLKTKVHKDAKMLIDYCQSKNVHNLVTSKLEFNVKNRKYKQTEEYYVKKNILPTLQSKEVEFFNFTDFEEYYLLSYIGNKESNDIYTAKDIEFIELISSSFVVNLNRVKLYQEVQSFNETLQHKVEEATEELKQKNKALGEALRKERDMLDILGHELRTPLGTARNAIMMLNMVRKSERIQEDDKTEHYLKIATENIVREVKILETILSSARIENDRLDLTFEKIDANDVVNDSFESYKSQAEKKGLKMIVDLPKKSYFAYADRSATQQIMDNLVSNAIKYTEEGSITVAVKQTPHSIEFSVTDTGEGIPKAEMKNLGKKFYRIKPYLDSSGKLGERQIVRPGGTGIGLFVVFNLLKNMNGKLNIESTEGKGSTFKFSLPLFTGQAKKELKKSDIHDQPKVKAISSLEDISRESAKIEK